MTGSPAETRVVPVAPTEIRIAGANPIVRTLHRDPRGFLLETLRADDQAVDGKRFRMSYSSLTLPGEYRDRDRWHVHRVQTDRFVVILGEMMLALWDGRPSSPSRGRLEVVRMAGGPFRGSVEPGDAVTYLVPIPPGVHHCIGNLSTEPFLLQNFPTELYDAHDEGRVPFVDVPIGSIGRPFSWDLVARPV